MYTKGGLVCVVMLVALGFHYVGTGGTPRWPLEMSCMLLLSKCVVHGLSRLMDHIDLAIEATRRREQPFQKVQWQYSRVSSVNIEPMI